MNKDSEIEKLKEKILKVEISWLTQDNFKRILKEHSMIIVIIFLFIGIHFLNYPLKYRSTDETVYIYEAKNFDIFKTYKPPAYPFFLKIVCEIFGYDLKWGELMNIIFTLATIVSVYYLGILVFDKRIGLYGAILYGSSATVMVYSHRVLIEPVLTFFIVLTIIFLILDRIYLTGATIGISLLLKDQAYFLIPIVLIYILVTKPIKDSIIELSKVFVIAIVIFSPWLYKIYSKYGLLQYFFWRPTHVGGVTWKVAPPTWYLFNLNTETSYLFIIFLVLGILTLIYYKEKESSLLLGIPFLAFFIPVSLVPVKAWYHMLPAFPFMSLMAARGLDEIHNFIIPKINKNYSEIITLILLLTAIFSPLKMSSQRLADLKTLDLGADRAGAYILQISNEDDVIMVSWCKGYYDYYTHFQRFPIGFPKTEEKLLEINPDYIVLDFNNPGMSDAPLAREYARRRVPGYDVIKVIQTDINPIVILKKGV